MLAQLGRITLREGSGVFSRGCLTFESVATHCVRMRHISSCHHPRKRVIQYSRDAGDCLRGRGVLDTPLSRGMTAVCEGAIAPTRSRNGDVDASRLNPQILGLNLLVVGEFFARA